MARKADGDSFQDPKWLGVTSDDLEEGLFYALDGEPFSERCLIEYFYERMTANQAYDVSILERYLTVVFKQVLERTAGKVDAELLLRRSRGRPASSSNSELDLTLSAAALLCIRSGETWEDACSDVADHYGVSDRKVQRALAAHRGDIEKLTDPELSGLCSDAGEEDCR
jgi:hypothetical protein